MTTATDTAGPASRALQPGDGGFAESGGVRIAYEVFGEGPETLLFLSPWAIVHSRFWKLQVPYLARHYGFELVGVVLSNVGQEPTAAELAALVEKVKATGVKAVFSEAQFNPKLAQTLADEAGVQRVVTTLYNDALGPPPADTYLGMMRWNMQQIVEALR